MMSKRVMLGARAVRLYWTVFAVFNRAKTAAKMGAVRVEIAKDEAI